MTENEYVFLQKRTKLSIVLNILASIVDNDADPMPSATKPNIVPPAYDFIDSDILRFAVVEGWNRFVRFTHPKPPMPTDIKWNIELKEALRLLSKIQDEMFSREIL